VAFEAELRDGGGLCGLHHLFSLLSSMACQYSKSIVVVDAEENLENFRKRCFELSKNETLRIPEDVFERYWADYVEHIFVQNGSKNKTKLGQSQYYRCRMENRKQDYRLVAPQERKRKSHHRPEAQCDVKVIKPN
jgi:hypothetical protein